VRYIFLGGTFPSGIKCLTHVYSNNKEEYIKVKKRSAGVAYLDKQKKKTKRVSDTNVRNGIKKKAQKSKIHTSRIIVSYQKQVLGTRTKYTLPKKKNYLV
jgi:hypothetical protein